MKINVNYDSNDSLNLKTIKELKNHKRVIAAEIVNKI